MVAFTLPVGDRDNPVTGQMTQTLEMRHFVLPEQAADPTCHPFDDV